jgi:acyl transferase domain-containing protein
MVEDHEIYLKQKPSNLQDLAYTLAMHRERLPYRTYSIGKPNSDISRSIDVKKPMKAPSIAMIFSGQGAQWPEMGKELMSTNALFKNDVVVLDEVLQALIPSPDWTMEGKSVAYKLIKISF